MSLVAFYHWDGTTKTDISVSVIDFKARRGIFPDLGAFSGTLTYPVLDGNGNEITLEKGDIIWPVVFVRDVVGWSVPQSHIPFQGLITNARREGDFLKIEAESLLAPLTRMSYTLDNSLAYTTDVILDILSKYTPPLSTTVGTDFVAYRNTTGSTTWPHDATTGFLNHGAKVDVKAVFQYLSEQPVHLWLQKPPCALYPTYEVDGGTGLPILKIGYSGYKNYRQTDVVMSYDTGILSNVEWEDPTESVLNDVTIKVLDGGSVQLTDAASIAAYGQRQTTLLRSIFVAGAVGSGYSAWNSAKAILESMKDPQKRCRLACEITALLPTILEYGGLVGLVYQIADDVTGITEDMCLRSMTYNYPTGAVECEFDNAPLNMATYGMRMENRVTTLESVMPNQTLDTTSSPTFNIPSVTAINIGNDCQISDGGTNLLYTPDSFQLAGGLIAGANSSVSGVLTITGRTGSEVSLLQLVRGANNYGWNAKVQFVPYTGDGALSDSKPQWWIQPGYSSHELNILHYNGTTDSPVMQFLVDKSVNIVNALSVASLNSTGVVGAARVHFIDGSGQIRSDSVIGLNNLAGTAYQGLAADFLRIGASNVVIDASRNIYGVSLVLPGTINSTITNEANTGAIRIDAGSNGYATIGPLNSSALHIYTDRALCVFNKTLCSVDANSELGTATYPWKAIRMNGSLYNNGQLFMDASRNLTLGAGAVTTTGALNAGSMVLSGNGSCAELIASTRVQAPSVRFGGVGNAAISGGAGYLNLGASVADKINHGSSRMISSNRMIYGTSYPFNCTASANYRNSHDAVKSYTWNTVYVKQKTITMQNGIGAGTFRVYFELASIGAAGQVYGKVYKNGVAIGTARVKTGTTYVGYSEDFSGPLEPDDTIELWCYQNGGDGNGGYCRNFRIGYDLGLPTTMPATNS